MPHIVSAAELIDRGLPRSDASLMAAQVNALRDRVPADQCWHAIAQQALRPQHPFTVHKFLYETVFADWDPQQGPWPAWLPNQEAAQETNIGRFMVAGGFSTYEEFRRWASTHRDEFWAQMIAQLGIRFSRPPSAIRDPASSVVCPGWLVEARLNIVDSCFQAPADATALVYRLKSGQTASWSYDQLQRCTNSVAHCADRRRICLGSGDRSLPADDGRVGRHILGNNSGGLRGGLHR